MYQLLYAAVVIHAQREREIEEATRRRRLLRPQEDAIEPNGAWDRRTNDARTLTPRVVRPTGG